MTDNQDLQVVTGSLISSPSSDYVVQDVLGSGTHGVVTQCKKLATNETVALKILKNKGNIEAAKHEEVILKKMKELGSDRFNIIRWNDSFTYGGHFCLEFEKLDISLHDFLQRSCRCLHLAEIRPIVHQLATALEFLKSAGIVHADLKPENIMMVFRSGQPSRVKVIDFGLATKNPKEWTGATVQTIWYRAPEVLLGASFNEDIDVWSLGCIAAEMLMGVALLPGSDEYDTMRHIFCTIGKPPDHLLAAGLYTEQFFCVKNAGFEPLMWRFMSPLEVRHFTCNARPIVSLNDLKRAPHELSGEDACADACDRESFVDLLTKMLKVDASERITPSQILQHPFITMSHLVGAFDSTFYVKMSVELMSIYQTSIGGTSDSSSGPACHIAPDEAHPAGLSSTGENSPVKKRKKDGAGGSECGNRSPDSSLAPKRRNKCPGAALPETGGKTSPRKSLKHKRKRDDADTCITSAGSPPAKRKRRVDLNKELMDSVKELLSNTDAMSSSTPVHHLKKRKRVDEEASGSKQEQTSPIYRRRSRVPPVGLSY